MGNPKIYRGIFYAGQLALGKLPCQDIFRESNTFPVLRNVKKYRRTHAGKIGIKPGGASKSDSASRQFPSHSF